MRIGIDIDGTISENPPFFSALSYAFPQQDVHIVTDRVDRPGTIAHLAALDIRYGHLHMCRPSHLDPARWKAQVVSEQEIGIFFDNLPEIIAAMPPGVLCFWCFDPKVYDIRRCVL